MRSQRLTTSVLAWLVATVLGSETTPPSGAPSIAEEEHHIRVGTFITSSTPKWILDAIRENVHTHNHRMKLSKNPCIVKNSFFVGHGGNFGDDLEIIGKGGDIVQGNFEENMNRGKSQAWLETALSRYPHADFIVKSDTDTAINLNSLCNSLATVNRSHDVYFGMKSRIVRVNS
jgi:hypothetical protein